MVVAGRRDGVVQIVGNGGIAPGKHKADVGIGGHARIAGRNLVLDRAGRKLRGQAGFKAGGLGLEYLPGRGRSVVAIQACQGCIAGNRIHFVPAIAQGGMHGDLVGEVLLDAPDDRCVLQDDTAITGIVQAGVRRRAGQAGQRWRYLELAHFVIDSLRYMDDVQRRPRALAAVIQRNGKQPFLVLLIVDRRIAVAVCPIEADAELAAVAEAASQVDMRAELRVGPIAGGHARYRCVGGALGHDIDGAGHITARGHAAEQCRRAFQDFHTLGDLHRNPVVRQHAVQTVERDILAAEAQAADGEVFVDVGASAAHAHGRVDGHQIRQGARLLVFDQLRGVAVQVERGIHEIGSAQHAQTTALGDLPARIRRLRRGFRYAVNGHGRHGSYLARGLCSLRMGACQWPRHANARSVKGRGKPAGAGGKALCASVMSEAGGCMHVICPNIDMRQPWRRAYMLEPKADSNNTNRNGCYLYITRNYIRIKHMPTAGKAIPEPTAPQLMRQFQNERRSP